MSLATISTDLSLACDQLAFDLPVTHVYNPLRYAAEPHHDYLSRYGSGPKEVLLLGMNPGPFGMGQTGVPFGDPPMVRGWLAITGAVGQPNDVHPKRPVLGLEASRSEVSGARLWGWTRDRFKTPERFFGRFFVHNYCPLAFMEETGRNRTPDKLPAIEREALFDACDTALSQVIEELQPDWVIGVGQFATKRAHAIGHGQVGTILHPSPASPAANRGWAEQAEAQLLELGIGLP